MENRLQQLAPCHLSLPEIWLMLDEGLLVIGVQIADFESCRRWVGSRFGRRCIARESLRTVLRSMLPGSVQRNLATALI
jgi:hypothetical protein